MLQTEFTWCRRGGTPDSGRHSRRATSIGPQWGFRNGGTSWSSFASGGTAISFPATGGNGGGYGLVDNTAGAWGGGLVSPADFEYPNNTGLPLASLGLNAGQTYTFSMDMINLAGTGVGGVKFESWGPTAIISNSGDLAASGQSAAWANYEWDYAIDAAATHIKIVPLLTPPTYGAGEAQSSIGFDNVGVTIPEPSSLGLIALGMAGLVIVDDEASQSTHQLEFKRPAIPVGRFRVLMSVDDFAFLVQVVPDDKTVQVTAGGVEYTTRCAFA